MSKEKNPHNFANNKALASEAGKKSASKAKDNPANFANNRERAAAAGRKGGKANKKYSTKRSVQAAISARSRKAEERGEDYKAPADIVLDMLEELHKAHPDPLKYWDEKVKLLSMTLVKEDKYSKVARKDTDAAVSEQEYRDFVDSQEGITDEEVSDKYMT